MKETVRALNKLLDLDLAIIEDAYQAEYMARLQRSERLATLGQVAGGVAHELRNPLNVVKTSVYYLLNARNPTPEKQADHLQRIERNVELADNVITALSNFAKVPVPDLRPIADRADGARGARDQPAGRWRSRSRSIVPPGCLTPWATATSSGSRSGNLIRNARDAMPQGGRLAISGRAVDGARRGLRRRYRASASRPRTWPGSWSRSTRPRRAGWAWGLQSRRSIVEKNQGSLRVTSEPGRGSIFTVRLTASPGDGAPP